MRARTPEHRNTALAAWYEINKRDLPWRDKSDPYLTLVSEAMLQQTQVDRVIPKFVAFVGHWPSVELLAGADTKAVLSAWSGLGYNSRALRLKAAAEQISLHGWPEDLESLPGVGPYTAAAIGSIAFDRQVPALDTNLKRVLSRWYGEPLAGSRLSEVSKSAVGEPAGDWNQALMDLGASLCHSRNPLCDQCPVSEWCADPTVYVPPPKQAAFSGSTRELRGAMVKAHLAGDDPRSAGEALGRSSEEIGLTIAALNEDGLLPLDG